MESIQSLPSIQKLSSYSLAFLNHNLKSDEELLGASLLVSDLQTKCIAQHQNVADLNLRLQSSLVDYPSFSGRIIRLFFNLSAKLSDLTSSTQNSDEGGKGLGLGIAEQILGKELPILAKEVARVESVRKYAETALKLDTLISEIEDVVSSTMMRNLRRRSYSQDTEELLLVIKTLMLTEDVLTSVTQTHPHWSRLVSAVDNRVDQALATLRPHAVANHRSLLASFGWPPPLSDFKHLNLEKRKSPEVSSPLFVLEGNHKYRYCDSFFALCSLQELQRQRKSRQLEGYNREVAMQQPLWAIEELVNPISVSCQYHFSKWKDKPELIFALVYKITRDYVEPLDKLLQPLVDKAMLVGYSCREEWISAMVTSLSTYLAKDVLPLCVGHLNEEILTEATVSWLHLVDLMITFDERICTLLSHSGISLVLQEGENLQKICSMSVFCDRCDWLDLWAEIELSDVLGKLKPATENEKNWRMKVRGDVSVPALEDYKSPVITSIFLQCLSHLVNRCRSLPNISSRSRFFRLSGMAILHRFFDCLLVRCQDAEGLTALADDDSLIKVATSINAAHHLQSVLKEWCDDVFFVEMGRGESEVSEWDSVFDEEIERLEEFRSDWIRKASVSILRGFDAHCRDHMRNKKQWQEKGGEGWTVSREFVGALDYLQRKCGVVEERLNAVDFVSLWRSLAAGADQLIFNGIVMSKVKFYDGGVVRFGCDLEVLFGVFRNWCLRPEGFFPKTSEGLKILRMEKKEIEELVGREEEGKKRMAHLSVAEIQKIARNRVFAYNPPLTS